MTLVHPYSSPPSRHDGRETTTAADAPDYGVLRGVFAPAEVLRRPLLERYAHFLRSHAVHTHADPQLPSRRSDEVERSDPAVGAVSELAYESAPEVAPEVAPEIAPEIATEIAPEIAPEVAPEIAPVAQEPLGLSGGGSHLGDETDDLGDETDDLADEMSRLGSEVGDAALAQPALQLALCIAARSGEAELASTAMLLGAQPAPRPAKLLRGAAVVNDLGMPPLHLAVVGGHTALVALLLEASAPPTLLSTAGLPPLVAAAQSDASLGALELLLEANAPLAMRDDRRQTALHAAARTGSLGALRRLLVACEQYEADRHAVLRKVMPMPTPPIHTTDSQRLCATTHPHYPSTLPIHTTHPHYPSTPPIHTTHPHHPSTPPIHTVAHTQAPGRRSRCAPPHPNPAT